MLKWLSLVVVVSMFIGLQVSQFSPAETQYEELIRLRRENKKLTLELAQAQKDNDWLKGRVAWLEQEQAKVQAAEKKALEQEQANAAEKKANDPPVATRQFADELPPGPPIPLPFSLEALLPRNGELLEEHRFRAKDGTPGYTTIWKVNSVRLGITSSGADEGPTAVTLQVDPENGDSALFLAAFAVKSTDANDVKSIADWLIENSDRCFTSAVSKTVGKRKLILNGAVDGKSRMLMLTVVQVAK